MAYTGLGIESQFIGGDISRRQRVRRRAIAAAAAGVLMALGGVGCGDDDDESEPDKPGRQEDASVDSGSSEMTRPTGGRSGGAGGTSGTDSGPNNDAAYRCRPAAGDIGAAVGVGGACCSATGICTEAQEGESLDGLPHDTCSARTNLRCVPSATSDDADGGAAGLFGSCRVQLPGAPETAPSFEGRCLPACFANASPIRARLQQATCASAELCAPCFNPIDGASTGVCDLKGDAPTEPAPPAFISCSEDLGYCVPSYAAGNSAGQLTQSTCATGELCAPKIKVANPAACFERCESVAGAGSCVPEFLTQGLGGFLTQASCTTGEICAPCEIAGTRTGVCD